MPRQARRRAMVAGLTRLILTDPVRYVLVMTAIETGGFRIRRRRGFFGIPRRRPRLMQQTRVVLSWDRCTVYHIAAKQKFVGDS